MKYLQGYFKPKNIGKYKGNPNNIIYRSSLELRYCCWLDDNPEVIQWSSEETRILYLDKATGKTRYYFPDFFYKTTESQYLVEVKPAHQCRPPKKGTKTFIKEIRTYATNTSKWAAAELFAKSNNMEWRIITEKDLAKL